MDQAASFNTLGGTTAGVIPREKHAGGEERPYALKQAEGFHVAVCRLSPIKDSYNRFRYYAASRAEGNGEHDTTRRWITACRPPRYPYPRRVSPLDSLTRFASRPTVKKSFGLDNRVRRGRLSAGELSAASCNSPLPSGKTLAGRIFLQIETPSKRITTGYCAVVHGPGGSPAKRNFRPGVSQCTNFSLRRNRELGRSSPS